MSEAAFSALMIFGSILMIGIWSISGSYLNEDRLKPNWMHRLFVGNTILLLLALLVGVGIEKRYGVEMARDFSFWYMHAGPPVWMFTVLGVALVCDLWNKFLLEALRGLFSREEPKRGVLKGGLPDENPIRLDLFADNLTPNRQKLSGVVVEDEDWEAGMEFGEDGSELLYESLNYTPNSNPDRPR